jgi:hypothetical protein
MNDKQIEMDKPFDGSLQNLAINESVEPFLISFHQNGNGKEMIKIKPNGDILIKEELCTDNAIIVDTLREWAKQNRTG